jgi:hypothetical protein
MNRSKKQLKSHRNKARIAQTSRNISTIRNRFLYTAIDSESTNKQISGFVPHGVEEIRCLIDTNPSQGLRGGTSIFTLYGTH